MDKPAKLLIFTTIAAPYRVDVFQELAKHVEITVCYERSHDEDRNQDWFVQKMTGYDVVISNRATLPASSIRWDLLKWINRTFDQIIFYEYSTPTALLGMLQARLLGIPYHINCDGAFINTDWIKKKIKTFFIKRASKCLAGSDAAVAYFSYYGASAEQIMRHRFTSLSKADILDQPVSETEKKAIRRQLGLNPELKYVVSVGQFIPRKGFQALIEAWRDIANEPIHLLLIGGGPEEHLYQRMIREYGLSNITLIAFKPKAVLNEYMKCTDLFVLPTREDVWGLVINEAMALGLPVITTNRCVAGVELIIDGENGYVVNVDETNRMVERIRALVFDDSLRQQMACNNIIKIRDYTIDHIVEKHVIALNDHGN